MAVDSSIRLRVDGSSAVRELNRVNKATNGLGASVAKLGARFAQLETARRFLKGFVEADKAAAAVRTLGVDSEKLRRRLLAVSNETKGLVSQTQLLEASYDVASAGFNDAASAANILKAATLGAVGGLSDLNTVADATTSVLNAYGLSSDKASKIVDGFIQTQNDGKIVVGQYANQIGRVAPIAAAAGVGIEELNAAISAVTATGVPVESTFAGLRQAIAGVIKPTEEARKTSELLGLEFSSAAIKTKGFGGFLTDVIEKTGGSEVALTKLFGSVEAVAAIMPLANDKLKKFNASLDNQKDSAGAAKKATEELGGTVSAQATSIVSNIGNVARQLDQYLTPVIKGLVTNVNNALSAFSEFLEKTNNAITGNIESAAAALNFFQHAAQPGMFTDLKDAVKALNPMVATSAEQLDIMQGALNRAQIAAKKFGRADDRSSELAEEITEQVMAAQRLITARRALLELDKQQASQGGKEDPATAALRAQVEAFLKLQEEQKNKGDTSAADRLARQAQGAAELTTQLERQIALTNEVNDAEDRRLQLSYDIADLQTQFPDLKDEERKSLEKLIRKLYQAREAEIARADAAKQAEEAAEAARKAREADPGFQMKKQLDELLKLENQVAAGATAIGNAFANSFKNVITGSKSAEQALADMMASVAEHFLDMATQIIAKQIAMILYGTIMKALGVGLPGGGGGGGGARLGGAETAGPGGYRIPEAAVPKTSGMNFGTYATGGYVSGPTNALIGEGGEPEYVLPQSKMKEAMGRYARGARGAAVIPDGPGGDASADMASGGGTIDVSYSVERINNVNYVSAAEFERGMAQAAKRGAEMGRRGVYSDLVNKRSVRSRVGV